MSISIKGPRNQSLQFENGVRAKHLDLVDVVDAFDEKKKQKKKSWNIMEDLQHLHLNIKIIVYC